MKRENGDNKQYPPLNLPPVELRLSREGEIVKVFDTLRKKFVTLTPEEYVRQHFVNWLINCKRYPTSLMANEIGIELNGTRRRCDSVVFDQRGLPMLIIEYKAPHIPITQNVFDQIVRYNMTLRAKYLIVSNGLSHYCCVIDYEKGNYQFIPDIPDYIEMTNRISDN